ncbi:cell division protein ZapB [Halomonas alkalicola]|uniref:cell division protein ZapB n=1 Tax=Halomonas alkalicola TaxID=1930622 RepID=UPI00265F4325|nr:cell division protein ZapB [Halomonas alkalicola]
MSIELFNRLEQKVTSAVEALELLKMEAEELREENARLKQEREEWERRLTGVLGKLEEIESSEPQSA